MEHLSDDHELKMANAVDLAAERMHLPELCQTGLARRHRRGHGSHRREAAEEDHELLGRVLPQLRADQVRLDRKLITGDY
jgi:hypothetical protein